MDFGLLIYLLFDFFSLLCLFAFCLTANATCIPGEDGKFTGIKLGGPSNISAPLGTDVHFICCGGYKWTYETDSEYAGREIGPHPEAAGSPNSRTNVEKGLMTPFSVTESQKERSATPTTVYTMHDDKGRLLLIINNVDTRDMGHYRCHALDGTAVDAFLVVTAQKYSDDESNPTVIATGSVIQRYMMFPSDKLSKVSLGTKRLIWTE
ncbi:hypothetical protein EG68_01176 [Paragonimus skrjabini miyazakii]|uniref:Ig-like domain-containing protein n=1 Tax=Paragonimus skrjabini miyazakii TaxID=59628 RepID=A0A8S9Z5I3_9TREM|nr:hypothetical protein EG68_01176 [Paragonimus skrjabini miyazakii]